MKVTVPTDLPDMIIDEDMIETKYAAALDNI